MNDVSEQQLYGVVRLFAAYVMTKYEPRKKGIDGNKNLCTAHCVVLKTFNNTHMEETM